MLIYEKKQVKALKEVKRVRSIKEFGVTGNGKINETDLIQSAIKACAKIGEELVFEKGTYVTVSLNLPGGSVIRLEDRAVIMADPDFLCWNGCSRLPLIYGENVENVKIFGEGSLCGSGEFYHDEVGKALLRERPHGIICFRNCKNIEISGLHLSDSVGWTLHMDNCERVLIDSITIRNGEYAKANCTDGIDLNGCRFAEIKNCDIQTGDDAICLKNINMRNPEIPRQAMHDIYVHDCTLATTCNGFKIGTETVGDIYDIKVENILLNRHEESASSGYPEGEGIPLSAIDIQSNDGASVHDIHISNFHATVAGTPLFIVLQKRFNKIPSGEAGQLYSIDIENFSVDRALRPSLINCCKQRTVKNISIRNMSVNVYCETKDKYKALQACGRCYPDPYNYGHFPAYGVFAYNTENLSISENSVFYDCLQSRRKCIVIENTSEGGYYEQN